MSLRPTWLGGAGIRLGDHPFGLDNEIGKDMFAMTMRGVQTTLVVIFVVGVLRSTIGVVIGRSSGYFGRLDRRVPDALHRRDHRHPAARHRGRRRLRPRAAGMWTVALALGLFLWTGLARLVRAEFLALREREFVDAARVAGASSTADHLQAHPAEQRRHDRRQRHAADGRRHPHRGGARLPRVRHPARPTCRSATSSTTTTALLDPAVAVRLARRVHRRHRAVPAVHRRRPARRVRPAPEAGAEAQGPRARAMSSRGDEPTRRRCAGAATRWPPTSRPERHRWCATRGRARRGRPAAIVPTCQRTGARSCSSTGSSR